MIYTIANRLGEIDWKALQPGDEVRIPWRSAPYAERVVFSARGTISTGLAPCRTIGTTMTIGSYRLESARMRKNGAGNVAYFSARAMTYSE